MIVEKLRRDHQLESFDCGEESLNLWLQEFAWTNQRGDSAQTYLALDSNQVVGYYALAVGSVERDEAPERVAKGLPRHPVGVVVLARLAVDVSAQGSGLGEALLKHALRRISAAADVAGVRAVLVHAIGDDARRFYERFGFIEHPEGSYRLMMMMKDLRRSLAE